MTDDLGALFEHALHDEPPALGGPQDVFRQASAMQRRHRLIAGVGAMIVIAVLTASLAHAEHRPATVAAPAPATSSVLAVLRSALPPDAKVIAQTSETGTARVVLSDDKGRTSVQVDVEPSYGAHRNETTPVGVPPLSMSTCNSGTLPAGTRCLSQTTSDGVHLVTVDGSPGGPAATGVHLRQVDMLTPSDLRVVVSEWNAVDFTQGPTTRFAPALSVAQLTTLVTTSPWPATLPTPTGR